MRRQWRLLPIRRRRLIALAALALLAFAPSAAHAATVSVDERQGRPNEAQLSFVAEPGEANRVSISVAAENGDFFELEVLDEGAPITPGAGCVGGGEASVAARCSMHRPQGPERRVSGKLLVPVDGTEWHASMHVQLGDGDNTFDASELGGRYDDRVDVVAIGGPGEDTISTGGGEDWISPGFGEDEVHSGWGYDELDATPIPDGPDYYDLGPGGSDQLSYARRGDPVQWLGDTAGAAGEGDRLAGVEYVAGGAGDDLLIGTPNHDRLEGNGGSDLLIGEGGNDHILGGPGNDLLRGGDGLDRIGGGFGNDTYSGGSGNDQMQEMLFIGSPGFEPELDRIPREDGGEDVADGGDGNDVIQLGAEKDRARGEEGDDRLNGGPGADVLAGGRGNDALAGGGARDRMLGGPGDDLLYAGSPLPRRPYSGDAAEGDRLSDLVDCGADVDVAVASPWDRVRRCETWRTSTPIRFRTIGRRGATTLLASVRAKGTLVLSGRGVRRQVRRIGRLRAGASRRVALPVHARGRALRSLRARGATRVRVAVRFRWRGGAIVRHRVVRLTQRR